MLKANRSFSALAVMVATLAIAALAEAQVPEEEAAEASGTLTAEELAVEPIEDVSDDSGDVADQPVQAADADDVKIAAVAENGGYFDEQGRYVVDLMEQDYTYLAIRVETTDGRPVEEAEPEFSIEGTSMLLKPEDVQMPTTSDEYGIVEFAVVAGQMGLDRISVEYGEATTEILVNVISLQATEYTMPELGEGFLPWEELMQARVTFGDMKLFAEFPESVAERSGETVRVAGFMMPLETGMTQQWFLLTSHPPGCFFHTPGGPSGAVEVFAEEGIEVSWDPIVVEGRFEALTESEGAVYRLEDARIVNP